ncbi:MAG: NTP transferase domain-containing protein [Calditrichaeota bacterium]|nr:NTP transferase domain-containing protein [Calditrichota bacterium]
MSELYAVIMAGGIGTRFWPRSRIEKPKQFLKIFGDETLIQQTYQRLLPLIPSENIYFVINTNQKEEIKKQLPFVPEENIIIEPYGKNTAPCIGLAALHLKRRNPNSVMAVLPADHLIQDTNQFLKILRIGTSILEKESCLITIGITPTYPATGYGYIQYNGSICTQENVTAYHVKTFAEKPNLDTAKKFIMSGDFLWNSGMFLWKTQDILKEMEEHVPEIYDSLQKIEPSIGTAAYPEALERAYQEIRGISIDYAVMEKSQRVCVIKSEFGWSDVGSWEEVYNLLAKDKSKNAVVGKAILRDSKGCLIYSPDQLVATIGLKDMIVIQSGNALLVCPKNRSQEVKELVDYLKRKKKTDYI